MEKEKYYDGVKQKEEDIRGKGERKRARESEK